MLNSYMIFISLVMLAFSPDANCQAGSFGVARTPSPVLNSPEFNSVFGGKDGSSLKTDRCGQVRELEYIALPGTVFKILKKLELSTAAVYQVETDEYPSQSGIRLYVDSRFLELFNNAPPSRKRVLPPREEVIATLSKSVGSPYVWGGNIQGGVPELAQYFYNNASPLSGAQLTLAGLDCSGLLYYVTNGWTPRNTSQLISFGQQVAIKDKNAGEIASLLQPLDLIVWNGHLLIVLDNLTIIESRLMCGKPGNGGVVVTPLRERLEEIMRTRKPLDNWPAAGKQRDIFVVRRWF